MKKRNFITEMASFIWAKKAYWILPVILFLILMSFLIITGSSPFIGFIYTLF